MLSQFINANNSRLLNNDFEKICWCGKYNGELYYNKRNGKFKAFGGCSLICIKALVIVLKSSVRDDENNKAIREALIKAMLDND